MTSVQTGLPLTDAAVTRLRTLTGTLPVPRQVNVDRVAAQLLDQMCDQITRGLPDQRKAA